MAFLLRVELPDVPGSLGQLATVIGEAGGDIDAIEIVEHRPDGTAVDDVILDSTPGVMPDAFVSACQALEGVTVLWISRYTAGGNLVLDLEAVEELTGKPSQARDRLVDLLPDTFRVDWGMRVRRRPDGRLEVVSRTSAAPEALPDDISWPDLTDKPVRLDVPEPWTTVIAAAAPLGGTDEMVVIARRGGPPILDSELARLAHLSALAVSIARAPA